MSDCWLPLYALAAHFAGDFPLQTDRMAAQKFDNSLVRAFHVAVYTAAFVPVTRASEWGRARSTLFLTTLAATHFVIDSRRWVEPKDGFETFPMWYDQALHIIALAFSVVVSK